MYRGFLHADPEEALARTNRKFMKRFAYIEEQLRISGKTFDQTDLTEMDSWWEEAKKLIDLTSGFVKIRSISSSIRKKFLRVGRIFLATGRIVFFVSINQR